MKKNVLIYGLAGLTLLGLMGCDSGVKLNELKSVEVTGEASYSDQTNLIISEYYEGLNNDRALEFYNLSDEEIDLSEYKVYIYSSATKVATDAYQLEGTLASKGTYVLAGKESKKDILKKANAKCAMDFLGKQNIALVHNDKIVDVLGNIGLKLEWGKNTTLVRKVDHLTQEKMVDNEIKYDEYSWIKYACENLNYLGNVDNSVTPEELLLGPQLEQKWLDTSFAKYNASKSLVGSGGVLPVKLNAGIDGDTSYFEFPQAFVVDGTTVNITSIADVRDVSVAKVRYQVIDTPESSNAVSTGIQEYGYPAKEYTTKLLKTAEELYVQTNLDGSLNDSYGGRIMGFVFCYNTSDIYGNEYKNRYVCSNFLTVKMGLSEKCNVSSISDEMTWKDVPYSTYFYNAFLYAQREGKGMYGDEKDPYWDYENQQYNGKEIDWNN